MRRSLFLSFVFYPLILNTIYSFSVNEEARAKLLQQYDLHCKQPSDINEHLPHLRRLARECSSVVELGVGNIVSTWGIILGLSESTSSDIRTYLGVDLNRPEEHRFLLLQELTEANGIKFNFLQANDMNIDIESADMLFIDTLHTYCHLTYELEKFSPHIKKYIAMHDTANPFGYINQTYRGDYSEYPSFINRRKVGLWQAVLDFLDRHPEWKIAEHYYNNHGFTVLERK